MLVSYNWLREYVDVTMPPDELAQALTMAGVEVTGIERPARDITGVVVGEVQEVSPIPGFDKLTVCKVNTGRGVVSVVTAADNVSVGCKVPLALPGARLPGGKDIREARFGEVISRGMMCSARELGLPEDRPEEEAGILLFPEDAPVGEDVVRYLMLDDAVLVLEPTPNRGDCLSIIGVAYEVAAITGKQVKLPVDAKLLVEGVDLSCSPDITQHIKVEVLAMDLCPRYSALMLDEVRIGPSPVWMQQRLRLSGMRPINNVVDVTNYVMLEVGQPLHAFDYDKIKQAHIIVRRANPGERIVTLDGFERELDPSMLVIADAARAIGIAGVMGGENTEVTFSTGRIILEAANFNGPNIRKTSSRLGIRSEAAVRFEKGVDPNGTVFALRRAAQLMEQMGAARSVRGVIDVYSAPKYDKVITLRVDRANEVLGTRLEADQMTEIFQRLGFTASKDNGVIEVRVPTRRPDINVEIDLVEEIGRIYGYWNIPATMPSGNLTRGSRRRLDLLIELASRVLTSAGLNEVITYSYHDPKILDKLMVPLEHPWRTQVELRNPMTEDQKVLRRTLLPGLINVMSYNFSRRIKDLAIFEIGPVYIPKQVPIKELPEERVTLGCACYGKLGRPSWTGGQIPADFYFLTGVLEVLMNEFGLRDSWRVKPAALSWLHPGRSAILEVRGTQIGFIGELHPKVVGQFDIKDRACVLELDFELLAEKVSLSKSYVPIPRYPSSSRDISLIVPNDLPAADILRQIRVAGGELIDEVILFDEYRDSRISEGYRSLAYSIVYRSREQTLSDEEVEAVHGRVRKALSELPNVTLRS